MTYLILLFLLPINLFCAFLSWPVAFVKGRDPRGWFIANLFLGFIGLILLIRLPRMQRCPCCGKAMREEAPGCGHCGYGMMDGQDGTGVEEYRYCASCQRVVDKNAPQCPVCGADLD